jgi:archaellum component FlaF (FlaF/FlaG flagellin family)
MKKSYLIVGVMTVLFAVTSAASAIEYEVVGGYTNCVGLEQAIQSTGIALTPGTTYTVTVTGNARANPAPGGDFDGVFCFFYDNGRPTHPVIKYLNKGDSFDFVTTTGNYVSNFFAFLADKSLKDIPDNSGFMTVTLTAAGREREELIVDAVFNCIGLEEFAAKKKILIPGESYVVTVTGNAYTNGTEDGYYDGVLLFTREAADPIHPIQLYLEIGEEFVISEMHATGWIYCWLVDASYGVMGNNGGKMTVAFEEQTPVDGATWGSIKALFQ